MFVFGECFSATTILMEYAQRALYLLPFKKFKKKHCKKRENRCINQGWLTHPHHKMCRFSLYHSAEKFNVFTCIVWREGFVILNVDKQLILELYEHGIQFLETFTKNNLVSQPALSAMTGLW